MGVVVQDILRASDVHLLQVMVHLQEHVICGWIIFSVKINNLKKNELFSCKPKYKTGNCYQKSCSKITGLPPDS